MKRALVGSEAPVETSIGAEVGKKKDTVNVSFLQKILVGKL